MGAILPFLVPVLLGIGALFALWVIYKALGIRVIPNDKYGVVERWWSPKGSLKDTFIALNGEAGYEPEIIRGGVHIRPGLMYRVSTFPQITIPQGQIGYVYARTGVPLPEGQTMAKAIPVETFQDVRRFLAEGGQQGPQQGLLLPGVVAINLAQFVVFTEQKTYYLPLGGESEKQQIDAMAATIRNRDGFKPVVISGEGDKCGVVTVHDGPSLESDTTGQNLICPIVGNDPQVPDTYHNNFQSPDNFIKAGGYRGRQLQVITDGTYWINRIFAEVELIDKTIIEVGFCGVVVSYVGKAQGADVSGAEFLHGELVAEGERGVWVEPLKPGKYAINKYAYKVVPVPTTNVILNWKSNVTNEQHKFDEGLSEIRIITKDAFEPQLPLSVVVHIDYKKAPFVIQRFGDPRRLVEQTLDPMVSAYFKNIGQTKTFIELLQKRGDIQNQATQEMKERFALYNLELEEVLMDTPTAGNDPEKRIEGLMGQLRDRQVATEQLDTFEKQRIAAVKDRELKEAKAIAEQQTQLTESSIKIQVQENSGKAELAKAQQDATKVKVTAEAQAEQVRLAAKADSDRIRMMGEAEADAIARKGIAEGISIAEQVDAFAGRPELKLASEIVPKIASALADGQIQLVPRTLVQMGAGDGQPADGSALLTALIAGKVMGVSFDAPPTETDAPAKERSPRAEAIRSQLVASASAAPTETAPVAAPVEPATDSEDDADASAEGSRKPRSKKSQN
jgi:uncharacterized membrane protein YqiK